MMKSKKGAIELSMTTIIVIVIGVTLLTLGILWVRGVIGNVSGLSDSAFEDAERVLASGGDFQGAVNAPSQLSLERGEIKQAIFKVRNTGEYTNDGDGTFSIAVRERPEEGLTTVTPIDCLVVKVIGLDSKKIVRGQSSEFSVGISAKNSCSTGVAAFPVSVKANGVEISPRPLIINIK